MSYICRPRVWCLNQSAVNKFAEQKSLILIAGRYEGIDERFISLEVDEEWSIGDYVLSGGELPAMVLIDALIRQKPGALGHQDSAEQDSFAKGLLDCPHYTRPEVFGGERVPPILLSGDHKKINGLAYATGSVADAVKKTGFTGWSGAQ